MESHSCRIAFDKSAVSLSKSRDYRYIKAISNNNVVFVGNDSQISSSLYETFLAGLKEGHSLSQF